MNTSNISNRNQYVLITGATSGFGYEFAKCFAKDGYNLILVARNDTRLQQITDELKQQYDVEVTPLPKNLFGRNAASEIYAKTKEMGINVNILVNDAGQGEWGKFIETDIQRQLDIVQLNVAALVELTYYFLKDMVARNEGKIMQLGSEVSKAPTPLMSVYAATKAFVLSFSEALINELKDTDVTVTVLMPGASDTDFFHKAGAEKTVVYREEGLSTPEDVVLDGYEALMKGESRIISGTKAKMHVMMSNMMPDSASAGNLRSKMEESEKNPQGGRKQSGHQASRIERDNINEQTKKSSGDYDKTENGKKGSSAAKNDSPRSI